MSQTTPSPAPSEKTTLWTDKATSDLLGRLAKAYRRSKAQQIAVLVEAEARKLAAVKLLPELEGDEVAE